MALLFGRRRRQVLPAETHGALVETLFTTVGSFLAGVVGAMIVPAVAFARSHNSIFLVSAAILALLAAFRIAVYIGYKNSFVPPEDAGKWERLYGIGAISFMTAVGLTAALLFNERTDEITRLYAVVISIGCAGALAARNAACPIVVYGQVLGVCGPIALSLLIEHNPWFWGLAVMMVLIMVSVKSTTKSLNSVIVSALLNGREAENQREQLSTALDSMSHGLCMGEANGAIKVVNERMRAFFDLDCEIEGLTIAKLGRAIATATPMSEREAAAFTAVWEAQLASDTPSTFTETVQDRIYDFRCEPRARGGFVLVVEDVTEARLAAREIEQMAHFDAVTGLPNRAHFHQQLEEALVQHLAPDEQLALMSIDLDHFKEVNDTRGHPVGDELLRLVARRLRNSLHASDMVARFGGDEFQVLVRTPDDFYCLSQIAQRLIDTISASYTIGGSLVTIGASVGIAIAPRDGATADELLRWADMALYQAKADGRGVYRAFAPEMDVAIQHKRELEQTLREALAENCLELHYQPVVDRLDGRVVACEALVRLRHPTKGMIPPGEFIPAAEETGLILQLGDWVLRRACRDAMTWPDDIRVAVNFSPKQFVLSHNLASDIQAALDAAGLAPHRLEVEITESTLIETKDALAQLEQIAASGVKISLDDFGTGYSSLSYLRQFPVDKIKIDRSFAQDVLSRASKAVIGSVSVLAQLLDVELVVEGVETPEQLDALSNWDVRLVQGYIFSRPVPLPDLMSLLQTPQPFATPIPLREVA